LLKFFCYFNRPSWSW